MFQTTNQMSDQMPQVNIPQPGELPTNSHPADVKNNPETWKISPYPFGRSASSGSKRKGYLSCRECLLIQRKPLTQLCCVACVELV